MTRPVVLLVDDETTALAAIEHELRKRYSADYDVMCEASVQGGLRALEQIATRGAPLALVIADVWMREMTGPEFLSHVHRLHPMARRIITFGWNDRTAAGTVLQGAALGQVDDWITRPWVAGDEHFHQGISVFLYEWARLNGRGLELVRVVGERWSARSHEIRDMLSRNSVQFSFYGADTEEGRALLEQLDLGPAQLPVVLTFDGQVLPAPSNADIAQALGVRTRPDGASYDVTIIGAGPAGLAAAVYGASEGLRTLGVEQEAIGGQAGSSSLIRNYLGFPRGVSGTELAARAFQQAGMLGAHFVYGQASALRAAGPDLVVTLQEGGEITSRAVILSTGVSYRRLQIPALDSLIGLGVFYGAAATEAQAMHGLDVHVVGGANSAGQAALHLAKHAAHVTLLVRGSTLAKTMSDYLVRDVAAAPNISVRFDTEVVDGQGDGRLSGLTLKNRTSGVEETVPTSALFVLIGAEPRTSWLPETIERDQWGYLVTGADLVHDGGPRPQWPLDRPPLPFETNMPGVFAVGDVRHGSIKRVASAVGDGSVAIRLLHEYLAQG